MKAQENGPTRKVFPKIPQSPEEYAISAKEYGRKIMRIFSRSPEGKYGLPFDASKIKPRPNMSGGARKVLFKIASRE